MLLPVALCLANLDTYMHVHVHVACFFSMCKNVIGTGGGDLCWHFLFSWRLLHGVLVGVGPHLAPAISFMAKGVVGIPLLRPRAVKSLASLPAELTDPTWSRQTQLDLSAALWSPIKTKGEHVLFLTFVVGWSWNNETFSFSARAVLAVVLVLLVLLHTNCSLGV